MTLRLPIDTHRGEFETLLGTDGRVVVTAPTGSGKSTRVPRWCAALGHRTLVVEPRRVACRTLASFVADSLDGRVGETVGYAVRHDHHYGDASQIVYATPGTVLRMLQGGRGALDAFDALILDELHERHIEVDVLLAFALAHDQRPLVVMSATLDALRVGRHIDGPVLEGTGRVFPVTVEHAERPALPSAVDLDARVVAAVDASLERAGDVLVFLPGKAEIAACARALRRLAERADLEVLPLHGGLSEADLRRPFRPGKRRRIVLATNVAETSVTLPQVGVVIDSGLVRQTRYAWGAGALTLVPIAASSAEQRRGRAGRTMEGHCLRLWSRGAKLESVAKPEILREDLSGITLSVAACGLRLDELPLMDRPPAYALRSALDELQRLGCVDEAGAITPMGREVSALPVELHLGRALLAAAAAKDPRVLEDAVDLVATLSAGRALLRPAGPEPSEERRAWRQPHCDATEHILALRRGQSRRDGLNERTLKDARTIAAELRRRFGIRAADPERKIDRLALARTWIDGDPRSVFARRRRGPTLSNMGTEARLARRSNIAEDAVAVVAVAVHTSKHSGRIQREITCAIPVTTGLIASAALGRMKLSRVFVDRRGRLATRSSRSFVDLKLGNVEGVPQGAAATEALHRALSDGVVFAKATREARRRVARWNLYRRVKRLPSPAVDFGEWLHGQVEALGFEDGADLPLLVPDDFIFSWPQELNEAERAWLDRSYPDRLDLGDASYEVRYDVSQRTVTLVLKRGPKRSTPQLAYLPSWSGFRVQVQRGQAISVIRS